MPRISGAIPLRRGRAEVQTFLSALGFLRETRLTAVLGYLISRAPREFATALVGRKLQIRDVRVEPSEGDKRYDVLLEGRSRRLVVEAKRGFQQHSRQVKSYLRRLPPPVDLVLLDRGSATFNTELRELRRELPKGCRLIFRQWGDVAQVCRDLSERRAFRDTHPLAAALAVDFVRCLQEEEMDSLPAREVYVRQLSGPSLDLFFRHHIYKCQARFGPNASQHRYFAPLFTARAPRDMARFSSVPIKTGLSWVAAIRASATLPKAEVKSFLRHHGVPDPSGAAKMINERVRDREVFVMALDGPFNLFTVPLSNQVLRVKGMLGQRSLTFAKLFELAASAR